MKTSKLKEILREELIICTYDIIIENINPDNHYNFEHSRKNLWIFKDLKNIQHFVILNQSLYKGDTIAEVKFGWVDNKNNKRYDKPPTYDEKIFNTHVYIILNELLNYYSDYFTEFYFEATDEIRYRLYRQTLNKWLNKSLYNIKEIPEKNTLIVIPP